MTVVALVASALGGGIVASIIESWFASLRAFETARLLVLGDLAAMSALSKTLGSMKLSPEDVARISYPTGSWPENRARIATRLARRDPSLLGRLSGFMIVIASIPPNGPLHGESLTELDDLRRLLSSLSLGLVGDFVVYGPRHATERYRKRRRRAKAGTTGAQTGAHAR